MSVAGKPANGQNVTSNASADVQAQEANISVTKTANPTAGSPSTNVTFTLDVNNTRQCRSTACLCQRSSAGWHDLCLILLRQHARRPKCLLVRHRPNVARRRTNCCRSSPISTDPLPVTRTLTNNVSVAGKPANGQNVTSNASADVQAQEAKISVTKTANPTAGSPSTNVTFTLDVKNTGSAPLPHVFVSDVLPVGMTYVSSSPVGVHNGRNVSWSDIGPMSPGGDRSLQIVAHIDGPVSGNQDSDQ